MSNSELMVISTSIIVVNSDFLKILNYMNSG